MQKRTKILATVGPASDNVETLAALITAGVNVFRLNFSHGTHEYHAQVLSNIRAAMRKTGLIVGVMQDISGPKIRVGKLSEDFCLESGDRLDFYYEACIGEKVAPSHYRLSISESSVLRMLKVGDFVYLYDGLIRASIVEINDEYVQAMIENKGKLTSNKGINFPNTRLGIDILTEKDRLDIGWGVANGVDFMAISFVQNAQDMINAREVVHSYGGEVQLIAKIEKFDAVENIDEILRYSDGLMVARGDLGIEVPYYRVPTIQKMLIDKANAHSKPVITATQMLLSMTEKESATRAEISDVANAVLDGTDAVMLSEESAVGHNPVLVVETMVNTIQAIEEIYPYEKFDFGYDDVMDRVNESAVRLGDSLNAEGIIAMSASGASPKKLSRYRPKMTIYAATHEEKVARLLTIVWGVVPAYLIKKGRIEDMLTDIIQSGLKRGIIDKKNTYIFTAGYPIGTPGTTNIIRILRENEITFFGETKSQPGKAKKTDENAVATLF
ncbi:pyruvate kinase [Sulfuricurvum kujiense DSM 16994]|uniref:Pyruvate kinase n=1 Tax=Sulfuricurvum kujiense (strain ATCC BAA-921 / DSM 16994 / JCM 11577 / YK-1) TaxID=709032 RepID=E4U0Q9_SULKY|nr:pyruvate kinase [Sulfuricurvum kujiense]ADR33285.1 pyruvate kinase [Sulfuricurvum kujiense DSM 16994]